MKKIVLLFLISLSVARAAEDEQCSGFYHKFKNKITNLDAKKLSDQALKGLNKGAQGLAQVSTVIAKNLPKDTDELKATASQLSNTVQNISSQVINGMNGTVPSFSVENRSKLKRLDPEDKSIYFPPAETKVVSRLTAEEKKWYAPEVSAEMFDGNPVQLKFDSLDHFLTVM